MNFKQPEVTLELVRSVEQLSYPNWEMVVVNNGTADETLQEALKGNDKISLVHTGENSGFAGGNNYGLQFCKGKYVFFVNNDAEVTPSVLEPLVSLCEEDPNLGMVSPKILFYQDKNTIQYAGATDFNHYTVRNKGIGHGEEDRGQYDKQYETGYIHGAAMMVPSAVIEKVGGMYEGYFLYYEEYDWCFRMRSLGYRTFYCGNATVYHKESISTGVDSPLKVYYLTRNRLLFARRNFTFKCQVASFVFFTLFSLPKNLLVYTVKGRGDLVKAMLNGWWWHFSHRKQYNEDRY